MPTSIHGDRYELNNELREALRAANYVMNRPSQWWSSPHLLDVINTIQEIISWANDERAFSAKHKAAWYSLIADYTYARKTTGALAQDRNPEVASLDAAMRTVNITLPNTSDGVPIEPSALESVKTATRLVLSELLKPNALKEAFDELVRASTRSTASSVRCQTARDYFWRLVEFQGANSRSLSDTLLGILDDEPYHVQQARYLLGERSERPTARYREDTSAGLSGAARFKLCRSVLLSSTPTSDHAVWVAYQHAHLPTSLVTVGPVTFYIGRLIHGLANSESIPEHWNGHLPEELMSDRKRFAENLIADAGDIVYARVDLGSGRYSDSVRVAQQIAQSVVTLASFTASTGHWQLCAGFLQVVNDSLSWTSSFTRPRDSRPIAATIDPTPVALEELSRKLGANFSTSLMATDNWAKLLEVLNWRERAKEGEPLARIVLDVRVIETIASWIGQSNWRSYLERYHKWSWIRTEINSHIARIGYEATHPYRNMDEGCKQRLRELGNGFIEHKSYGRIETNIKDVLLSLDLISTLVPAGTRIKRDVDTLRSNLSDANRLRTWCSELSHQWTLVLDRAQRIRNSLAHGGPVNDAAAASVSRFIRSLSGWSVYISLEATMASNNLLDAHDSWKRADEIWKARVDSSDSVAEALFPD